MYLIFPERAIEAGAKRKVYVGANSYVVADARAKVERTTEVDVLRARAKKLYEEIERLREQFKHCAYIAEDCERLVARYR